ncbi:GNAT family N-acetyltransferase [Thalassotalea ganghwensis]
MVNKVTAEHLSFSSERLIAEPFTLDDWHYFRALHTDELMQFIGSMQTTDEIRERFEQRVKPWTGEEHHWLTFKLFTKVSKEFIGSVGFKIEDLACERAELGYIILSDFHGKGYVTEALKALVEQLFNQFKIRKIIARCAPENIGSWKVMEKIGMEREAHFKQHHKTNETWFDEVVYGLVK